MLILSPYSPSRETLLSSKNPKAAQERPKQPTTITIRWLQDQLPICPNVFPVVGHQTFNRSTTDGDPAGTDTEPRVVFLGDGQRRAARPRSITSGVASSAPNKAKQTRMAEDDEGGAAEEIRSSLLRCQFICGSLIKRHQTTESGVTRGDLAQYVQTDLAEPFQDLGKLRRLTKELPQLRTDFGGVRSTSDLLSRTGDEDIRRLSLRLLRTIKATIKA
ncbi:hypothetical protein BD324DRAFT_634084 [Kockovaella imperatae]|uniref:Uncharacterized protein n=1 Tax=Kockovaella imperatae TaxID=4999 RepID=A0A1Y1UAU1_9TREE|nr:hypothetical protein BD324DRAFT_634084 [Kockovaella imperatae]ORX35160.1 hypothetical protein BD324DRAFT_634084 [Kockovaella imperatae]